MWSWATALGWSGERKEGERGASRVGAGGMGKGVPAAQQVQTGGFGAQVVPGVGLTSAPLGRSPCPATGNRENEQGWSAGRTRSPLTVGSFSPQFNVSQGEMADIKAISQDKPDIKAVSQQGTRSRGQGHPPEALCSLQVGPLPGTLASSCTAGG